MDIKDGDEDADPGSCPALVLFVALCHTWMFFKYGGRCMLAMLIGEFSTYILSSIVLFPLIHIMYA